MGDPTRSRSRFLPAHLPQLPHLRLPLSRRGRRPKLGVPPQEMLDLLLIEPQSLEIVAQHLDKLAALLLRALANQGGNRLEPARHLVRA